MGYLDRSINATLRKAEDGRLLFFPWGALGRGYIIPSNDRFERMRPPAQIFSIALLIVLAISIALMFYAKSSTIGLIPLVISTIIYAIWAHYNSRGLHYLPMRESLTIHSLEASVRFLGFSLIIWAFMVLSNILRIISEPNGWLVPLTCVIIFGYFVVIFIWMLLIRRRHQLPNGA